MPMLNRLHNALAFLGLTLCSCCSLLAASAKGTPSPLPAKLSLGEAKRIAFEQSWDLLAAHSDIDIAQAPATRVP